MEDGFDGFLLSPAQMAGLHVRGRLSWRTAVRRQNWLKGQVRPDPNASARSRGDDPRFGRSDVGERPRSDEFELLMFPCALHQIQIDEVLIWNARLLGHVFEVFDRLPREVHGHRPAGRNGIGVRLRVAEIIFVARVNVLFLHIARSRGGWSSYRILLSPSACRHLASAHAAFHIYPLHNPQGFTRQYLRAPFCMRCGPCCNCLAFCRLFVDCIGMLSGSVVLAHDFVEVLFDEVLWVCFPL